MNLNDLFRAKDIDPQQVLVLRHRPKEPKLNRALPRLAAEKPSTFNAYQQTQSAKLEKAMLGARYVASFIGREAGKALFVGLYSIGASKPLTYKGYWRIPEYVEMRERYGMKGPRSEEEGGRSSLLWFELALQDFYTSWKGKLVVKWPPPELSWWRWAHRNEMPVLTILRESELVEPMREWDELVLSWGELTDLPASWKDALRQWRVIYYIFDTSDSKGYVGSAYGKNNVLARWQNYKTSGHGGNTLLRQRNPQNFRFSILERVSPDMSPEDVIQRENTWKNRLYTHKPYGLNDN
jgi:hypothetical protein